MDDVISRIMHTANWPELELPENLELLNEIADKSFSAQTFPEMLSAVLMYHQLIEAMCLHLLEDCHFLIQLSVHPAIIQFQKPKSEMLGTYVKKLTETVSFYKKKEFLERVTLFNSIRNNVIHEMRKSNLDQISENLRNAKIIFDEIYNLYDEAQDDFRVIFHGFRKDVFGDEYGAEE